MSEWRGEGNPLDQVQITVTAPRWVLQAATEALAEAADSAREDNDAGLNRWAYWVEDFAAQMEDADRETVRVVPGPADQVWSWRHIRYVDR